MDSTNIKNASDLNAAILKGGIINLVSNINCNGETVNINNPITISGEGSIQNTSININSTTKVLLSGFTTNNLVINITNSSFITIEKCCFANIIGDKYGFIYISNGSNDIKIVDNYFSNIQYVSSSTTYACGIKVELNSSALVNLLIKNNKFTNIHGPAAIWLGYSNSKLTNVRIEENFIQYTESFGIELYGTNLKYSDVFIVGNTVMDTGSLRARGQGAGCGGIYCSNDATGVFVINNVVKRVKEVGIEGGFQLVFGNYIEDTGNDQLNYPISDSSGIYNGGSKIINNVIVNPGKDGGIYNFTSNKQSNQIFIGNVIKNEFNPWSPVTSYKLEDLVVSGVNWYVCSRAGISGTKAPTGVGGSILDSTCMWNYKKPLATKAIDINAIMGIENVLIKNNSILNVATFLSTSKWNSDMSIEGNSHICDNTVVKIDYITSYNTTFGKNIIVTTGIQGQMPVLNYNFAGFSSNMPDGWTVNDGVVSKVLNDTGSRIVPEIIQGSASGLTKLVQTFNLKPGKVYIEARIKTNNGIKLNFLKGTNSDYLSETSYADTSENYIIIQGYANVSTDKLTLEISTKDVKVGSLNYYLIVDYIKIYEI